MTLQLQNNAVLGVYQGQTKPLKMGDVAFDLGPHKIGWTLVDDSATVQAFYDPSLSECVQRGLARGNVYQDITYLQVGRFGINGAPLDVTQHDESAPYPLDTPASEPNRKRTRTENALVPWWVDICKFDANNALLGQPYYPYWILQNNANFSIGNLHKYPYRYGGLTRYGGNWVRNNGDLLCATMNKLVDLSPHDLPYWIPKYFEEKIQLDDLVVVIDSTAPEWLAEWATTKDITKLLNALVQAQKIPAPIAITNRKKREVITSEIADDFRTTDTAPAYKLMFTTNGRYFVSYRSSFHRGPRMRNFDVNIAIFYKTDRWVLVYLDMDPFEIARQDAPYIGIPDIQTLRIRTGQPPRAKKRKGVQRGLALDLDNNKVTLSYKFITYACAKEETSGGVNIALFDGFIWQVEKRYDNLPDPTFELKVVDPRVVMPWSDEEFFLKEAVERFFGNQRATSTTPYAVTWVESP